MKKTNFKSSLVAIVLVFAISACRTVPNNPGTGGKDSTNNGGGHDTTGTLATSAIDGLVLKGPITPVQRIGEINSAPLAGATISISQDNTARKPTDVVTDTNGRYYLKVGAGTYTLTPQPFANSIYPRPQGPMTIVVPANTTVRDTLNYDTGIR
jgi:hypothetical protein